MRSVTAATVSEALIRDLRGPRDEWGAATEALCQFYELVGKKFGQQTLHMPERVSPASVACMLGTQIGWQQLSASEQDKFAEGLASLRTIEEKYFECRLGPAL